MFDIVLLFLDHLFPSVEDLFKEPTRKAKIRKEIFLLYENLCQIVVNGHDIEFEIKRAISFLREKRSRNQVDQTYSSSLGYKLGKQSIYLAKFFNLAINLTKELDQFNKVPYTRLSPLYTGKCTLITDLIYTLRGEYRSEIKLVSYDVAGINIYLDKIENNINGESLFVFIDQKQEIDFIKSIRLGTINETNHMGQKDYESLEFYLKHEDLDLKFDQLKLFANYFKKTLVDNFTLSDVILDVSDKICNEPGIWGPRSL